MSDIYNEELEFNPNYEEEQKEEIFTVAYMDKSEEIAMNETPNKGCWYCGSKKCCLTHKYDNYKNAQYPERNPYR